MKKERGILLTILIIVLGLSYVIALKPAEYEILYSVLSLLGLVSLYGVWIWKKWGLYLQITVYIISFVISVSLFRSQKVLEDFPNSYQQLFFGWAMLWGLIPAILGYFTLKKKWHFFK